MPESSIKSYPNIVQSFAIAGIVVLSMVIMSPLSFVLSEMIGKEAATLIYYTLAMGIAFLIVYTVKKRYTRDRTFNLAVKNTRLIPWVMAGTVALLFGIIVPITDLIPMPESFKTALMELVRQRGILAFFLMVIAAPVLEESIFRGIILDGLLRKYSPAKSILVSSFLFGLVHLNPWQFVAGLVIGVYCGWIYYHTRSLSLAIIIHATANLSGFLVRRSIDIESALDLPAIELYGGQTNFAVIVTGSILTVSFCIFFLMKEFSNGATSTITKGIWYKKFSDQE